MRDQAQDDDASMPDVSGEADVLGQDRNTDAGIEPAVPDMGSGDLPVSGQHQGSLEHEDAPRIGDWPEGGMVHDAPASQGV